MTPGLTIMIGPGGDSKAWGVFYPHQQGFAHCIDRTQLMGSVQSLLSKLLDSLMYSRSTLIIRSLNVLWHKGKFHRQMAKVQNCNPVNLPGTDRSYFWVGYHTLVTPSWWVLWDLNLNHLHRSFSSMVLKKMGTIESSNMTYMHQLNKLNWH